MSFVVRSRRSYQAFLLKRKKFYGACVRACHLLRVYLTRTSIRAKA